MRNIPAHAGKTAPPPRSTPPSPEHPRACGENVGVLVDHQVFSGTSPRMRGKHPRGCRLARIMSNIPAHAGKTLVGVLGCVLGWEHPRACGENT